MKKYLLSLAITAFAVSGAMAQSKELKVAIDPTYEPFTYKTPDGKPAGFDVDIANAVCEQMKRKCVFVEQVWDSMIPGLQARKYDVIVSSMSITEDRLKVVDFSDKYYNTPSKIVVKNDVKFDGLASLKGKKLGVLKGSTQEKYANGELKKTGHCGDALRSTGSGVPGHQRGPARWHGSRCARGHGWFPEQARRQELPVGG